MKKSTFTAEYQRLRAALIEARHAAGLTQQELADRLNAPQSFVSKVETGDRRMDLVEFVIVVRALGGDPGKLLENIIDDTGAADPADSVASRKRPDAAPFNVPGADGIRARLPREYSGAPLHLRLEELHAMIDEKHEQLASLIESSRELVRLIQLERKERAAQAAHRNGTAPREQRSGKR